MPEVPDIRLTVDSPEFNYEQPAPATRRAELNPALNEYTFLGWGVTSYYLEDKGLRGAPVAAPPGQGRTAAWRVHGGQTRRIVTFVAQSIDRPPIVPHPDALNPNELLIDQAMMLPQDAVLPDGKRVYTVAGQFVYLLLQPLADTDPRFIGTNPFSTRINAQRELRVSDFIRGLIAPTSPPAGGYGLSTLPSNF